MNSFNRVITVFCVAFLLGIGFAGCYEPTAESTKIDDVLSSVVVTNAEGFTVEQQNILDKQKAENMMGALQHLYLISPFTGDVIDYSTVKGKVTSSGKRLQPYQGERVSQNSCDNTDRANLIVVNGVTYVSAELRQADGTYGSSIDYLYWWDASGNFQRVYPGAAIIRLSSVPLVFNKAIMNLDK